MRKFDTAVYIFPPIFPKRKTAFPPKFANNNGENGKKVRGTRETLLSCAKKVTKNHLIID